MKVGKYFFITATLLILIIFFSYFLFLLLFLDEKWDTNLANFGVFGDSFGVLTSLFSALTILGLIYTVNLQREDLSISHKELELTREELNGQKEEMILQNRTLFVQQFENTLFKMIDLFSKCRDEIHISIPYINNVTNQFQNFMERSGTRAIGYLYNNLFICKFNKSLEKNHNPIEEINSYYSEFYDLYGDLLDSYFRTLCGILNFIDKASILEKRFYSNIVRELLSKYEISFLFYNYIIPCKEEKMKPLLVKYNLIKHLDPNTIPKEHFPLLEEVKQRIEQVSHD